MREPSKDSPTFIATPKGDELVILTRAHYDRLVGARRSAPNLKKVDDGRAEAEADAKIASTYRTEWVAAGRPSAPLAVIRRVRAGESWLKAFRGYRGITQSELAKHAGIRQGYLSEIETTRKRPSADARVALAKALDIHPSFLSQDAPATSGGDLRAVATVAGDR